MLQYMYRESVVEKKLDGYLDDVALKKEIVRHVETGTYKLSKHAAIEQAEDDIDLGDTLHVLKTGYHEKGKTLLVRDVWKYAIRGRTEDREEIRVIICFSSEMMIITVMKL